jgi:SAM-dependent methyltransferase
MRLTDSEFRAMNSPLRRLFQRWVELPIFMRLGLRERNLDILHHIPQWRDVIRECHRVLRAGGRLFLEEPDGAAIRLWDKVFHWNHPREAAFSQNELEEHLKASGFVIQRRIGVAGIGAGYSARKDRG